MERQRGTRGADSERRRPGRRPEPESGVARPRRAGACGRFHRARPAATSTFAGSSPARSCSLPVHVPGALLSLGDVHFAQGDGEVCGTGIEIAAAVTVRLELRKAPRWSPRFPTYVTPARPGRACFATTGISEEHGMDLTAAARAALLAMIDWLEAEHGLSRPAAYCLCSACVDLRIFAGRRRTVPARLCSASRSTSSRTRDSADGRLASGATVAHTSRCRGAIPPLLRRRLPVLVPRGACRREGRGCGTGRDRVAAVRASPGPATTARGSRRPPPNRLDAPRLSPRPCPGSRDPPAALSATLDAAARSLPVGRGQRPSPFLQARPLRGVLLRGRGHLGRPSDRASGGACGARPGRSSRSGLHPGCTDTNRGDPGGCRRDRRPGRADTVTADAERTGASGVSSACSRASRSSRASSLSPGRARRRRT